MAPECSAQSDTPNQGQLVLPILFNTIYKIIYHTLSLQKLTKTSGERIILSNKAELLNKTEHNDKIDNNPMEC